MKILLLEDNVELANIIQEELENNDYIVDCCYDGETAMMFALRIEYAYDLVIVDRMLPIIDGLTIIKTMRKKGIQIPVIITTALSTIDDRIEGLDGGADDYLVKPFHIKELLARIRALIRRPAEIKQADLIEYEDLVFQKATRELSGNHKKITLTAREAELLYVFMKNPSQLFKREQLVLKIWGTTSEVELGNVDNYISFLRKRLKELGSQCEIKTVYGAGYKLVMKDA